MKYHGVIVEGSDCSGKTTLVKQLKAALSSAGWDVLDMGHRPGDQFRRYAQVYAESQNILLDRGHFSEVAYGDLWRDGRHFASWERQLLDHIVRERFLVVLCTAPPNILRDRHIARSYGQVTQVHELESVQRKFEELLIPFGAVHYESKSDEDLARMVQMVIEKIEGDEREGNVLKAVPPNLPTERFVLLEGANGSGKSTLAKCLKVNLVGWSVQTLDYDPVTPPFDRFLREYLLGSRKIFDRGHISEIVYGDMFRGGQHFSEKEREHLCAFVRERGIVVLCEADAAELQQRIATAQYPKHINSERLAEVKARFRAALDRSEIPYRIVDTSGTVGVSTEAERLAAYLGGRSYSEMGWEQ